MTPPDAAAHAAPRDEAPTPAAARPAAWTLRFPGPRWRRALRPQRSLLGEMLDWMLAPLLLLWPTSVLLTWLVAQHLAERPYDEQLARVARLLAAQASAASRVDTAAVGRLVLPPHDGEDGQRLVFQLRGAGGELLAGEPDLPPPPPPDNRPTAEPHWRDARLHGTPVRVAHLWLAAGGAPQTVALLQVAEPLDRRTRLAKEIVKGVLLPQLVVLPLAVLLVWLALARGIAPLNEVQRRIRSRDSADLSPLDEREVPEEVSPLVRAINDLLARLDHSIATQKHFLADAAHQLKTPLAGLRMQAELAQREIDAGSVDPRQLKKSLQQIARSSQRAAHMVNQLLAMARAEDKEHAARRQPVDLARLAAQTVRDFVPRSLDKGIDLGYEGDAPQSGRPSARVDGHLVLLRELLVNLVDNALLYTPRGGAVTVRVTHDAADGAVLLQVEDSGPGIAADEREQVFRPFYRAPDAQADGSGLGLAIVQEIARQHGATIVLDDARPPPAAASDGGPGARFTLRFAALPAEARAAGDGGSARGLHAPS